MTMLTCSAPLRKEDFSTRKVLSLGQLSLQMARSLSITALCENKYVRAGFFKIPAMSDIW